MKLHQPWFLFLALSIATAFQPCFSFSEQAKAQTIKRLSLTEALSCSLNVWNKEIRQGEKDVKLTDFHLIVRARYLGQTPKHDRHSVQAGRFLLKRLDLKYFKEWDGKQRLTEAQNASEEIDWDRLKICTDTPPSQELPILQFAQGDSLAQVTLHSTLAMGRNDLMRIGVFEFQPQQAGFYELHYQLQGKRRTTFETREVIEFYCPPERPQLAVLKAGVLHQVRVPYIHMPLVASTFFEPGSEVWNGNRTDRIYRSVFWGLAAKRIACHPIDAKLLLLDDPTSDLSAPARLELANRRAHALLRLVQEKSAQFQSGGPCATHVNSHSSETNGHAHAYACTTGITIQPAGSLQSQVFIKSSGSEISPQWFAEENRVVPLVASLPAQRLLFQPLLLKPMEDSDFIELRCENVLSAGLLNCVREAFIEVTNSFGEKQRHEVRLEELLAAAQNERPLRLNAAALQEFLKQGEFTAQLWLHTSFSEDAIASNAVSFKIERRSIVRDEVFALSPYDRVDLIYDLDHERISKLSRDILQTVRDSLSAQQPEIFVLISGHSDSLGEHRAQGLGRDYNISLSFSRAAYLKRVLLDSINAHAGRMAMPGRLTTTYLNIPQPLRESVKKHVNNPAILEVFQRANCRELGQGCQEQLLQSYLDLLLQEKVRHFKAGELLLDMKQEGVPSAGEVLANLQAIKALIPMEVSSLEFTIAGQRRLVHLIGSGMGAAVPFYRALELSGELQEVFCRMGFSSEEMPKSFFGKDAFPAGRLMNRRVELNMIW